MKICYYGKHWIPVMEELEKDGHVIIYNHFSASADIVLVESHSRMYNIYPILKKIRKYNVKFVNLLLDVPVWRLSIKDEKFYIIKLFLQYFYNIIHRHRYLDRTLTQILNVLNNKITKKIFLITTILLNTKHYNKIYYQKNYKKFLKTSDLNLSISKFTRFCYKKMLGIDSKVWYPGVNSNLIESIEDLPIEYDMINISRIIAHKRQNLIVNASKKLGLKLMIIGKHQDKNIKLDCLHSHISNNLEVMRELKKSRFYVDASIFEGFGLTPVEAAFSGKITIASDIYTHKEVLGNYPLYFIRDNLDDLIEKINQVLNNKFHLDKEAVEQIKSKYSLESAKNRLENHLYQLITN